MDRYGSPYENSSTPQIGRRKLDRDHILAYKANKRKGEDTQGYYTKNSVDLD